jgi:hypothetical protein
MHRRTWPFTAPLTMAMLCCVAVSFSAVAQEASIESPEPATITFTNGSVIQVEVQSLDSKVVRFKSAGKTATFSSPSNQIASVRTAEHLYTYNPGREEFFVTKVPKLSLGPQSTASRASPQETAATWSIRSSPLPPRPGPVTASGARQRFTTVVVEGSGATAELALKDAFRQAVRRVVGVVVDAETLVKNDELISDKVLTYSKGFVPKWEEISSTEQDGVFTRKISARVEFGNVVAKLKESSIAVKNIDGKGLFGEAVTRREAQKDAAKLIENALAGYPANVIKAQVIGKPRIPKNSDTDAVLQCRLSVAVDAAKYKIFLKTLLPILEQVAVRKNIYQEVMQPASETDWHYYPKPHYPRSGARGSSRSATRSANPDPEVDPWASAQLSGLTKPARLRHNRSTLDKNDIDPDSEMVVIVHTSTNAVQGVYTWRGYQVPDAEGFAVGLEVDVIFVDKNDQELLRRTVDLHPASPALRLDSVPVADSSSRIRSTADSVRRATLAPLFMFGPSSGFGEPNLYAGQVTFNLKIPMPLELVEKLKNVRCSVTGSVSGSTNYKAR